ncbi:MAG: TolC family protein [Myxococcota bacterium]
MNTLVLLLAVSAPSVEIGIEDAARRAVARGPRVEAARARLQAAESEVGVAQAGLLPRLELVARYSRLNPIDNDPLVNLGFDVDAAKAGAAQIQDPAARDVLSAQLDGLAGLAAARIQVPSDQLAFSARLAYPVSQLFFEILPALSAREEGAKAASFELDVARNVVALEGTEALLGLIRARRALEVSTLALERAETNLAAAQARVEASRGTQTDVLRLEARRAEAERLRATRAADARRAEVATRTLLGVASDATLEPRLSGVPVPPSAPPSELVARALKDRDEARALGKQRSSAGAAASAARGGLLPRLSAEAFVAYENPSPLYVPPGDRFRDRWSLSAVLSWSPDGAFRASKSADAAEARAREVDASLRGLEDLIRIEVEEAAARLEAALVGLASSQRAETAAARARDNVRGGFEEGVFDATDLIDAELQLEEARLGVVDATVGAWLWQVRLRRRMGVHLWESSAL